MQKQRLKTYTITAGTTLALAGSGSVHAAIIQSTGSLTTTIGQGASGDFLFALGGNNVSAYNIISGSSRFASFLGISNFAVGSNSLGLNNGENVSAQIFQQTASRYADFTIAATTSSSGNMPLGVGILIGVKNGGYYGWIEYSLSHNSDQGAFSFIITDWAYNDVNGQSINAGQYNAPGGSNAVPGLGGLAALAIGAAGVRSRRQRTVA
jgi:hypothetical protein